MYDLAEQPQLSLLFFVDSRLYCSQGTQAEAQWMWVSRKDLRALSEAGGLWWDCTGLERLTPQPGSRALPTVQQLPLRTLATLHPQG